MERPGAAEGEVPWSFGCKACFLHREKSPGEFVKKGGKNLWGSLRQTVVSVSRMDAHRKTNHHKKALKWLEALRNDQVVEDQEQEQRMTETKTTGITNAHIFGMLSYLETGRGFRYYEAEMQKMRQARGSKDFAPGNHSRRVARSLCKVMAGWERWVTRLLLAASSVSSLAQDARDTFLLMGTRSVLWDMPQKLGGFSLSGVRGLLPGEEGLPARPQPIVQSGTRGPPWIADRFLGFATYGVDRSGVWSASAVVETVKRTMVEADAAKQVLEKMTFFTADNASDENVVFDELKKQMPQLMHCPDATHSLQIGIKQGTRGDPECDIIQGVCLTNKKPYRSISNMCRRSSRVRALFTEEQLERAQCVISHMGWAPQRHSSRARALSRQSLKITEVFSMLAREAEGGHLKRDALHNLRELSPYRRLMLCGLLADVTFEHHLLIRQTDTVKGLARVLWDWAHCPPGAKLRVDAFFSPENCFSRKYLKYNFFWGGAGCRTMPTPILRTSSLGCFGSKAG